VQAARPFKGGLIIRFEGVEDRSAAEPLRDRTLLLAVEEVRPLEANEYFLHDLSGLEVKTIAGEVIGRVLEVYEAGPSHFLGVDDGERERLIPFTGQIVREVDMEAGTIVIEPIPGLLDV
jgi:16S rRNA processing protein RimM